MSTEIFSESRIAQFCTRIINKPKYVDVQQVAPMHASARFPSMGGNRGAVAGLETLSILKKMHPQLPLVANIKLEKPKVASYKPPKGRN